MVDRRRALGAAGEAAVADWYRARGWEVVASNWRCREGEIDLVVRRKGVLAFCEVKSRTSTAFGAPVEAVTATKQARLRKLAARWLAESGGARASTLRFDVASVLAGQVEIVENAF